MTNYYVKTDGNDALSGLTILDAWQSPATAAQRAQAGDVISLLDGIWNNERVVFANSGIDGAPIIMTAYSGTPTLDGTGSTEYGILIDNQEWIIANNIKVLNNTNIGVNVRGSSHITIDNITAGLCAVKGFSISAHDCVIKNCTAYNNDLHNFAAYNGAYNTIFENCYSYSYDGLGKYPDYGYTADRGCYNITFRDCLAEGVPGMRRMGHGLVFSDWTKANPCHDCIVDNVTVKYAWEGMGARENAHHIAFKNSSVFHDSLSGEPEGYYIHAGAHDITVENCIAEGVYNGYAFKTDAGSNHIIKNCVAYNCYRGIQAQSVNTAVRNSIATGGHYGIYGPVIATYCDVWNNANNYRGGASVGTGCISEDPLFINPTNHNFYLKSTGGHWTPDGWIIDNEDSPCLCVGEPNDDNSNEPEPNCRRINMGIYGNTLYASKESVCPRPISVFTHNAKIC